MTTDIEVMWEAHAKSINLSKDGLPRSGDESWDARRMAWIMANHGEPFESSQVLYENTLRFVKWLTRPSCFTCHVPCDSRVFVHVSRCLSCTSVSIVLTLSPAMSYCMFMYCVASALVSRATYIQCACISVYLSDRWWVVAMALYIADSVVPLRRSTLSPPPITTDPILPQHLPPHCPSLCDSLEPSVARMIRVHCTSAHLRSILNISPTH